MNLLYMSLRVLRTGPRFNIKMTSYPYRKSNCGDKTILRPSYLHNGISYTGKMASLYWIGAEMGYSCGCIKIHERFPFVYPVISPAGWPSWFTDTLTGIMPCNVRRSCNLNQIYSHYATRVPLVYERIQMFKSPSNSVKCTLPLTYDKRCHWYSSIEIPTTDDFKSDTVLLMSARNSVGKRSRTSLVHTIVSNEGRSEISLWWDTGFIDTFLYKVNI